MSYLDRTQEFNNAAESIRLKQMKPMKKGSPTHNRSQFATQASKIGKDIYDTSDKLAKLTKLAKSSANTLFNDHSTEIEELTFIIKQNIHTMNKEIATLRDFTKSSGSSGTQNQSHSDTIITYLNSKLATTTKDFTDVLQVRTGNLKTQQERRSMFSAHGSSTKLSTPNKSVLYKSNIEPESPARTGGEVAIAMPQQMMMVATQQDDYTNSRAAAVENIERAIVELGGIFQHLATLVAEQGDMIQRIDDNIDKSEDYVNRGNTALLKVLHNVSSSRMLIVKLFVVMIIFAVIFIVFFV